MLYRGSSRVFPEVLPEDEAAIAWPSAFETPTVWVRGLSRQPFWNCHEVRSNPILLLRRILFISFYNYYYCFLLHELQWEN